MPPIKSRKPEDFTPGTRALVLYNHKWHAPWIRHVYPDCLSVIIKEIPDQPFLCYHPLSASTPLDPNARLYLLPDTTIVDHVLSDRQTPLCKLPT